MTSIIPPILTCLVGKRLGDPATSEHYHLRNYAASLIKLVCKRFGESSHTLRPRLTRACLRHFLDPSKTLGTHYGAIIGLAAVGGRESVRVLILPNLKLYEKVYRPEIDENTSKRADAEMVVEGIINALGLLEQDETGILIKTERVGISDETREALAKKVGDVVADRLWKSGKLGIISAILGTASGGLPGAYDS